MSGRQKAPRIAVERDRAVLALCWSWPRCCRLRLAPNIRILGANPDFVLIAVVAVALLRGAEIGAVFGFVAGGLVSLALFEPPGIRSLVLVAVGYLVGRYAETAELSSSVAPLVSVFVASIVYETLSLLAQFLLGRQVPIGYLVGSWVSAAADPQHAAGGAGVPRGALVDGRRTPCAGV